MMRKKIVFILVVMGFAVSTFAVQTRTTIQLNDVEWKLYSADKQKKDLNKAKTIDTKQYLVANIEMDVNDVSDLALYLNGLDAAFEVLVNGETVNNELEGDNFHAMLNGFIDDDALELTLLAKKNIPVADFQQLVKHAQIAALNNVFICHVEIMEDEFFGGKMVTLEVKNRADRDVDGKMIANILDAETLDIIAENSNCVFARQESDIIIDVTFPDAEGIVAGTVYLVELIMVDKENNEEVVDQLTLPLQF